MEFRHWRQSGDCDQCNTVLGLSSSISTRWPIRFLPNTRIQKAISEVPLITAATGMLSVVLKNPIPAEANPATPICKNPNNAEALPTFLENGASAKAVALGLVSPKQVNAIKNRPIVASSPYQLFHAPNKKTEVVTTNVYNDTWKICSLE